MPKLILVSYCIRITQHCSNGIQFNFIPSIESLKATIAEKKQEQIVCNTKIKDIETNLADAKGYRDRQLKEAKDNMQKMKEKSEKSRKEWQKREQVSHWLDSIYSIKTSLFYINKPCLVLWQEAETLKLEIEGLMESIEKAKEEVVASEAQIEEFQQRVSPCS